VPALAHDADVAPGRAAVVGGLVLAAGTGSEGPGPLVSYLVSQGEPIRLPVTLVPGQLSKAEIDAVT
jgi:hypothetical protein